LVLSAKRVRILNEVTFDAASITKEEDREGTKKDIFVVLKVVILLVVFVFVKLFFS
jgi:hypothetical protein